MSNEMATDIGPPPRPALWRKSAVSLAAFVALLGAMTPSFGATLRFKADLSGGGEAPPNNSPGKAHLEGTLDTDTNALTWTVTYSGLTGAPIGAHFHGPVSYIGLTPEGDAPIQVGTTGSLASPFKGSATIDETQKKDLKGGRWYFNIHTPAFPSGEIRGPVVME
jgi:CHRD domain